MAQENEPNHSFDPTTVAVKRKRGRPRKEDVQGAQHGGRSQRRRQNPLPTTGQDLVGQPVAGFLDGVFDAGFLITVRVGNNGPTLRGMVFDSRLCVPISAENDVAPNLRMSKREDIRFPVPVPAEPLQRRGPTFPLLTTDKVVLNDGSQGSCLGSKVSDVMVSGTDLTASKEATPVTVKVVDNQRHDLTGELQLDSTNKASQGNKIAGEPNPASVSASESKLDSTSQIYPRSEGTSDPKLGSSSQTTPGNETAGELSLGYASQTPAAGEAAGELAPNSTSPTPRANKTRGELQSKKVETQVGPKQVEPNASAAPTQILASHASSEVLPGTKDVSVGNGDSQMP